VVKALFEHRMLPRVLAGSSVGSIVAGIVATRTDAELSEVFSKLEQLDVSFFNNSRAIELVHSFLQKGALHDMSFLQRRLKALLGNYTFLEAYERTGRILNVSVCPADTNEPARLLNYLTAPQALIWSAVAASSAFPGLFAPQDLLARNAHGEEVR
jgi:TAG lipase/steryl ester hydrolase/phospholipase A2/LPA acyltransferase